MVNVDALADQIDRAYRGESWHGPSVREVLDGVSAEDAAAHPIPGAHSIWEIVLHMISGYKLVLRRVRGEPGQYSEADAWPGVADPSAEAWRDAQHRLDELNQELQAAVRVFPAERLSQALGAEYSAFIQFAGAPQHDLYHAGQMVMLKKAQAAARGTA